MYTVPGCKITSKLYESSASLIYRGIREADNLPVILKILKQDYPSPEELVRYRQEYEITSNLELSGVIKVYGQEKYGNSLAIILEDFGGESLRLLEKQGNFTLRRSLQLAIRLARITGKIHEARIIHKDINPSNIIYNPENDELKIIDFGISTKLARELPELKNPERLEGTLAYMSPEQTGRMNRAVDYRTDFYALGATLYELFTGQLPFPGHDPMELVHSHLAREPAPPRDINPELSRNLSNVILKLLAKRADERYQTAHGLISDLEFCLDELDGKTEGAVFSPGENDISTVFNLPQKLYGREQELTQIMNSAKRASLGKSQALFVAGYSGIGKSALIKELHKTLIRSATQRGYFITGKFEQYHSDIPYSAVQVAFRDLIRQLLTENKKNLLEWKKKLNQALGINGGIMAEFLPELTPIIGVQAPAPKLDAAADRNRFTLVLRNFILVFLQGQHPLVLFLDDLQWADMASLELIKSITAKSKFLFLIGAYRDNEVLSGHILLSGIKEMREAGVTLNTIKLTPLKMADARRFIADTTRRETADTDELAQLIMDKTHGNPFFLREFLESLRHDELIIFDKSDGNWVWDITRIKERNITDNVVVLLTRRIEELPEDSRAVLNKAACLGNTFALSTLSLIHGKSPGATAEDLWPALERNMLQTVSKDATRTTYKFEHDRIEEAAYNLLPEIERQALHLKIGRLLRLKLSTTPPRRELFVMVDHLNLGRELINEQDERDEAAELNYRAGSLAQSSTAFTPALTYYKIGLELLGKSRHSPWERAYKLTLELTSRAAETAMLAGYFSEMEIWNAEVLEQSTNLLDRTKIYEIQIQAFTAQNNHIAAVEISLNALEQLHIVLPKTPGKFHIVIGLLLTKLRLLGKSSEDIFHMPKMQDPFARAASRILAKVGTAAYFSAPEFSVFIVFQQLKLSLRYGNAPETPYFLSLYGMILAGILGQVDRGYTYGKLALRLMEHLNIFETRAKVIQVYNFFIRHWKEPVVNSIPDLEGVHQIALETGDLEIAALSLSSASIFCFWSGYNIKELEKKIKTQERIIVELGQKTAENYINILHQALQQLQKQSNRPFELAGVFYDENEMVPVHEETRDKTALVEVYFWKMLLSYLFQAPPELLVHNANMAEKYLDAAASSPAIGGFYYYDSLVRLTAYPSSSRSKQKRFLKKVKKNQKQLEKFVAFAPSNHQHRFFLVEAETARVLGRVEQATRLYDKAIEAARENNFLNDEAIAWEVAGRFYLEFGPPYLAGFYLKNAHYSYDRWGADAKVAHLEKSYPEIFASNSTALQNTDTTTGRGDSSSLDLSTIIKASQAISREIVLDSLLRNMMRLLIENAGAEKGYFLLEKDGNLFLETRQVVSRNGGFISEKGNGEAINDESQLPLSLLDYAMRTGEVLVLANAFEQGDFTGSIYIQAQRVLSVLCVPIKKQGRIIGLLYLENNLTPGAFTAAHVKVIEILSAQIELSIENARLYGNLEEKVRERTKQLESALGNVQDLKNRQDGDYFLTSTLLEPLCENTSTDTRILSDILIKQYKTFKYEKWEAEIGGDMCACHDLTLREKTYTLFLNADAMGKSMQGAGGSLVLLAALKALLGKVNASSALQEQSPEAWLAGAYSELYQIFATFNGFMQVSLIMGLADGEKKRLYFFNAEHPPPVLYRRDQAEYFKKHQNTYKLGNQSEDPVLVIETMELEAGDIVLMGSDGKDDLQTGLDQDGHRIIYSHSNVFLECVMEGNGDPEKIRESLAKRGDFIDDFSLLRLRVTL